MKKLCWQILIFQRFLIWNFKTATVLCKFLHFSIFLVDFSKLLTYYTFIVPKKSRSTTYFVMSMHVTVHVSDVMFLRVGFVPKDIKDLVWNTSTHVISTNPLERCGFVSPVSVVTLILTRSLLDCPSFELLSSAGSKFGKGSSSAGPGNNENWFCYEIVSFI